MMFLTTSCERLLDTIILIERLREQSEIEREELVEEVRAHIERCEVIEDTRTLEKIDLRTAAEIQQQAEDGLAEQFETGRWDKRANGLMKLGVSVFIPIVLSMVIPSVTQISLSHPVFTLIYIVLSFILFVSAVCWVLITTAQSLKYNILPFLVELVKNPKVTAEEIFKKFIKNPGKTIRESWNEL
jgi:hypothetical protein